jgi:hypothetical protein
MNELLMMESVLKNRALNSQFDKEGFVKLPLFSEGEVTEIKAFYQLIAKRHNILDCSFHTTLNTSDNALIAEINSFLLPFFKKNLSKYMVSFEPTIAGFLVKNQGKYSAVTIHQDWNYVDESKYSSYSFWVSLEATNLFNGCMQFIPGSHKFYPSLRISPDIDDYFHAFKDTAADYLMDVPTKAGECVLFNQGIIHASRRNFTRKDRVVCILGAYPSQARLLHYFRPEGNSLEEIEQYEISVHSMINMKKNQKPPQAKFVQTISYSPPVMQADEFINKCKFGVPTNVLWKNRIVNALLGKSC